MAVKDVCHRSVLQAGCPAAWANNSALYGNATATSALALSLLAPSDKYIRAYRSNDEMRVEVEVLDALGQRIAGARVREGPGTAFILARMRS